MQLVKVYKGKLSDVAEQIKKEKNEYFAEIYGENIIWNAFLQEYE
tara:strand:- start:1545 stop:1679 length:135 start_codon:yes stop_codon:yes gene_type:complete